MLGQDARYGGLADVRADEIGTAETVLGVTASTPMTRSTSESRRIRRTRRLPSWRATPVTSTTLPKISAFP